jgi:hypothetical protein
MQGCQMVYFNFGIFMKALHKNCWYISRRLVTFCGIFGQFWKKKLAVNISCKISFSRLTAKKGSNHGHLSFMGKRTFISRRTTNAVKKTASVAKRHHYHFKSY